MTSTNNIVLQEKGLEAAARYLYRRGYDILEKLQDEERAMTHLIARDETGIVVAEVHTRVNENGVMPEESNRKALRRRLEKVAIKFLTTYDEVDVGLRLDVIDILVVGEGRALIRHHLGAATMDDDVREERVFAEQEDGE